MNDCFLQQSSSTWIRTLEAGSRIGSAVSSWDWRIQKSSIIVSEHAKRVVAERIIIDTYTQWKGLPQQQFSPEPQGAATPQAAGPSNGGAMNPANNVEM